MELKKLKVELKEVKLHLFRILARSTKWLYTTGTNIAYISNISTTDIENNTISPTHMISVVEYKNMDLLCKYIPMLKIPNLCIRRDVVATMLNKAIMGGNLCRPLDKLKSIEMISPIQCGELGYLRYGFKEQKDGNWIGMGLDKSNEVICMKIDKIVYTEIPVAFPVKESDIDWFKKRFEAIPELPEPVKIYISERKPLCFLKQWDGFLFPYADGVTGVSVNGYIKNIPGINSEDVYSVGHLVKCGSYCYLVIKKDTEKTSITTIPAQFRIFNLRKIV